MTLQPRPASEAASCDPYAVAARDPAARSCPWDGRSTELLEPLDLDGAVVTLDALHTVRANLNWLVEDKKAHYIAVVKKNQPLLHAQVKALPPGGRYRPASRPATPGTAALRPAP